MLTVASPQKEMYKKVQLLKEEHSGEKQRRLQVSFCLIFLQKLKEREEELAGFKTDNDRLQL